MENKEYSSHKLLLKMLDSCKDELETLIAHSMDNNIESDDIMGSVKQMIDEKFGPSETGSETIDLNAFLPVFHDELKQKYPEITLFAECYGGSGDRISELNFDFFYEDYILDLLKNKTVYVNMYAKPTEVIFNAITKAVESARSNFEAAQVLHKNGYI